MQVNGTIWTSDSGVVVTPLSATPRRPIPDARLLGSRVVRSQSDVAAVRVTVLDDYQGVAADMADWSSAGADVALTTLHERIDDEATLAAEAPELPRPGGCRRALLERAARLTAEV